MEQPVFCIDYGSNHLSDRELNLLNISHSPCFVAPTQVGHGLKLSVPPTNVNLQFYR